MRGRAAWIAAIACGAGEGVAACGGGGRSARGAAGAQAAAVDGARGADGGAAERATTGGEDARPEGRGGAAGATTSPGVMAPTLDEMAAHGARLAPGMRVAVRVEVPLGEAVVRVPLLRAEGGDTCLRVAFAPAVSGRPPALAATLENARGEALASIDPPLDAPPSSAAGATTAPRLRAIPPRGPVCVSRGDVATLRLEPDARTPDARVRVVVWTSR